MSVVAQVCTRLYTALVTRLFAILISLSAFPHCFSSTIQVWICASASVIVVRLSSHSSSASLASFNLLILSVPASVLAGSLGQVYKVDSPSTPNHLANGFV